MLVTYKPDGQEPRSWVFDPGRTRLSEAAAVERQYGEGWEKFAADVQSGSAKARRVLLWMMLRRDHPVVRFDDTPDLYLDEVLVEHTAAELAAVRDRVTKAGLPEGDLTTALAVLDAQIEEAKARPELAGYPGKAESTSGA